MDQSDYPSLPRLNHLHARLAAQSRRVTRIVDNQLNPVDQLFRAAAAEDWTAAARAIESLANLPGHPTTDNLVHAAQACVDALRSDEPATIQTHLKSLLAECRAAKMAHQRSEQTNPDQFT